MNETLSLQKIVAMAFKEMPKEKAEYFAQMLGAMARKALGYDSNTAPDEQTAMDTENREPEADMAMDNLSEPEKYEGEFAGLNNFKTDPFYDLKKRKIAEDEIANLKDWSDAPEQFQGLNDIKIGFNPTAFD